MDAKSPQAVVPSAPLMYQTWFLKVSIHCEGCRRKVKKVLQSIDGVFTTTVDAQQQKVTVTGSVGVETLIRKLARAGKHAEIWPENIAAGKGSNTGKVKQLQQQKKKNVLGEESDSKNKHSTATNAELASSTTNSSKKKVNEKSGERGNAESKSSGGGENDSAEAENKCGKSEGGGKKKKKEMEKSESGGSSACNGGGAHSGSTGQVNLIPTRQQSYQYPETYCYPPLVYLATHNRLCPMGTMGGPSYYVSPLPYMCAGIDHDPYRLQSTPLVPFEIFSDDNANACSIMIRCEACQCHVQRAFREDWTVAIQAKQRQGNGMKLHIRIFFTHDMPKGLVLSGNSTFGSKLHHLKVHLFCSNNAYVARCERLFHSTHFGKAYNGGKRIPLMREQCLSYGLYQKDVKRGHVRESGCGPKAL
ncbi:hypothetical protein VNO80_22788 [Phaseolus coccineus]|uniref:HMA domain-containing protein n=1 Tax=Phaseolus coccineus TaxID=3886 RepID=A0AAN9MAI0_PHACN